jgi:hypothetical protein
MPWLPRAPSSLPAELALVAAPPVLWRVARAELALRFSQLNLVDAANDRGGNRFDVPGASVLYGAIDPAEVEVIGLSASGRQDLPEALHSFWLRLMLSRTTLVPQNEE